MALTKKEILECLNKALKKKKLYQSAKEYIADEEQWLQKISDDIQKSPADKEKLELENRRHQSFLDEVSRGQGVTSNNITAESKSAFSKGCQYFIENRECLEFLFLKFLFMGLPRLGKTTSRRRLMGEIINLISAQQDQPYPSTNAVEGYSTGVREASMVTAGKDDNNDWSLLAGLEDESCMLFLYILESIMKEPVESENAGSHQSSGTDSSGCDELNSIPELDRIIEKALKSEHLIDCKRKFTAHLRVEDTGGQPELMDMLPALTMGPGFYLLFLNLENDLKSTYKISRCNKSGQSSDIIESTYTVEEMLLSGLSSIMCSSEVVGKATDSATSDLKRVEKDSKSVVYFVGTHKDKATSEQVRHIDTKLQELIGPMNEYRKDVIQYSSPEDLIVTMDNMNGGINELKEIRKLWEDVIKRHFKKIKIPIVWVLFYLCLRLRETKTVSLDDCIQLSNNLNMSPEETREAIEFLHHHAGVLKYFPKVEALKDTVILDNQVLYDSVTTLIFDAMTFDSVGHHYAQEFKTKGQFKLQTLKETGKISEDLIPLEKLIALLEYLLILVKIDCSEEDRAVTYFMPCVLQNSSKEELDLICSTNLKQRSAAPLLIYYNCGTVPLGVFPALVAYFIQHSGYKMVRKTAIKKNYFLFKKSLSHISFVCRPRYLEINIVISKVEKINHDAECARVRLDLELALKEVSHRFNYGDFLVYQFAFKCKKHNDMDHLSVVKNKNRESFSLECLDDETDFDLDHLQHLWFGKCFSECGVPSNSKYSSVDPPTMHTLNTLKDGTDKISLIDVMSPEWETVGDLLGMKPCIIETIKADRNGKVKMCCRDLLVKWMKSPSDLIYPFSWDSVVQLLLDLGLNSQVKTVNKILGVE